MMGDGIFPKDYRFGEFKNHLTKEEIDRILIEQARSAVEEKNWVEIAGPIIFAPLNRYAREFWKACRGTRRSGW